MLVLAAIFLTPTHPYSPLNQFIEVKTKATPPLEAHQQVYLFYKYSQNKLDLFYKSLYNCPVFVLQKLI